MERTLVLIKPDALARGLVGDVTTRFERKGLLLVGCKMMRLDDDVLAERVGAVIAAPVTIEGATVRVTASIGVALARGPGTDPGTLLRTADQAMYQAKERGKGTFQLR